MKLSIWQQFSSNHSASFTVVAEFQTEQEAFNQHMLIRRALRNMIQEFEQQAPEARFDIPLGNPPHDIEIETWKPFGIQPRLPSDWLPALTDKWIPVVIKQIDNFILFRDLGETWTAAEPVDRVLEKLGATIYRGGEAYTEQFDCTVTCTSPDETTAIKIAEALDRRKYRARFNQLIPWLPYFHGSKHPQANKLVQIEQMILQNELDNKQWEKAHQKLRLKFTSETDPIKRERYRQDCLTHRQSQPPTRPTMEFDGFPFYEIYRDMNYQGNIMRDGKTLTLKIDYVDNGLPNALVSIVAWMRDMGCNVKLSFAHTNLE